MAIPQTIKILEEGIISKLYGGKYAGLEWCELGNQKYQKSAAKPYYESLQVIHTSIDLNGFDSSLVYDLGQPIMDFNGKFDVITNYGTIEHVNNQYEVFKNVHNMCKVGGVMIHGFPFVGNWPNHCRYYYTLEFLTELTKSLKYNILHLEVLNYEYYVYPKNLVFGAFIKENNGDFISEEEFNKIEGLFDSKDTRFTQNYSKR